MNKNDLIEVIKKAFDGVEQPKEITLSVAEAHDGYDYDNNSFYRNKDYIGTWQNVPSEDIENSQAALSYVDKVGMRFYLPAYMVWYLKNWGDEYIVRSDHTLYSLSHYPNDPSLAKYHIERFSLFTPDQLRACALFVKYCAENGNGFSDDYFAAKKYERYWSKYM